MRVGGDIDAAGGTPGTAAKSLENGGLIGTAGTPPTEGPFRVKPLAPYAETGDCVYRPAVLVEGIGRSGVER